jgi:hypothetical protein
LKWFKKPPPRHKDPKKSRSLDKSDGFRATETFGKFEGDVFTSIIKVMASAW